MNNFFEKRILPAITFDKLSNVMDTVSAIRDGGLNVLEVAFRTGIASEAISMIRENFDDMLVGAGTLLTPQEVRDAKRAGAQFGLSPGFNQGVVREASDAEFPFIPGVMTPSEVAIAIESGCRVLKLFPADLINGVKMISALTGPYGHKGIGFIPMGGINTDNMKVYLESDRVIAVGGSWLATKELIINHDFGKIKQNIWKAVDIASQ